MRRVPDKKIKLMLTYPMTTGRNFDAIVRLLDSLQLTARENVATPILSIYKPRGLTGWPGQPPTPQQQ
jgi:hypothetical protein